jgi:hypothetical protein
MSYAQMPTNIPWNLVRSGFHKTPSYSTLVQTPASGRGRSAIAMKPYPTWNFVIDLYMVQGGEGNAGSILQAFLGLYLLTQGRGNFFLFTDPNDNVVDAGIMLNVTTTATEPMGQLGDGTSNLFQLARNIGPGVDILQQVSGVEIFVNGTALGSGAFSLSSTGVVNFASAPPVNAVLTWTGGFQYLCQFTDDTLKDLSRASKNFGGWLWECPSISLESVFV